MQTVLVTVFCLLILFPSRLVHGADITSPVSPEDSIKHFQLAPGLRVELAACEPQVMDPIEIRFDESGRMWVVEMGDYPFAPPPGHSPRSRIRILDDRDQDGRFETSTVFADKLLFATGLQPWNGGVIVTLAGQVAFLKDTDGDGRADIHETWFTGFAQENSQLRANHPRLGMDGYIYIANGLRGGSIVDARNPAKPPLAINNLDFRFDPNSQHFEAVTGAGQFGLTFDDFGNRFVCSNRNPLMHIVLEDRFLKHNPQKAVPEVRHDVAKAAEQSRVFARSRAWTTSNLHAGQFTAACGVLIYRGDSLPAKYYGSGFTCDPTGNLVHCELIEPQGASFTSHPERDGVEFMASPDEWFRPVNCEFGPDGALYVVDMYRAVIEHPDFVPDELKRRPDQMLGTEMGRIYRIVADDAKRRPAQSLAETPVGELVKHLGHPNGWQRDTAYRLLCQRKDKSIQQALEGLATGDSLAAHRCAALWTLHGIRALTDELLVSLLSDSDPRVREQAAAACEDRTTSNESLRKNLRELATDADARVRFQVAFMLSPATTDDDVKALSQIAKRAHDDVWTRRALAVSAGERAIDVALDLLREPAEGTKPDLQKEQLTLEELCATAGFADVNQQREFAVSLTKRYPGAAGRRLTINVMRAWLQSLARRGRDITFVTSGTDNEIQRPIFDIFVAAAELAQDKSQSDALRIEALELLVFYPDSPIILHELARQEPVQAVRVRAISLAARRTELPAWRELLADFGSSSPAVRRAILEGSLARADRSAALLDEVSEGHIKVGELDQLLVNRLVQHGDPQIRERAIKLLADSIPADRQQVLTAYQAALQQQGDALKGRQIFAKNCANCHQIGDLGVNVAPDISDSRVKTATQLLTDIVQPNRAIDNNYVSYLVSTVDGETFVGVLSAETATSITVKMPEAKTVTLLRTQIDELRSTGVSLMPEGLEKNIPIQDMADLITFIKNWRYLDGRTPLSQ